MENPKNENPGVVFIADAKRRQRDVPALSDTEILRLRKLLDEADAVLASCPVAKRILKGR